MTLENDLHPTSTNILHVNKKLQLPCPQGCVNKYTYIVLHKTILLKYIKRIINLLYHAPINVACALDLPIILHVAR